MIPSILILNPFQKGYVKAHTRKGKTVGPYFTKRPPAKVAAKHTKKRFIDVDAKTARKLHRDLEAKKHKHQTIIQALQDHHDEISKKGHADKSGLSHSEKLSHIMQEIENQKQHIENHTRKQELIMDRYKILKDKTQPIKSKVTEIPINKKRSIYSDKIRKAEWEPGYVTIHSFVTKIDLPTIRMENLILSENIRPMTVEALKKAGKNPSDYRVLSRSGTSDLVAPIKVAESIYSRARDLQKKYEIENKRIANLTSTKERKHINAIYAKAKAIENSNSENNVWLSQSLRSKADKMLEEWRKKYPKEANKEKADELLSKADRLKNGAKDALVYDADGWLNEEERQKRHDKMIEEAKSLEKKAENLMHK